MIDRELILRFFAMCRDIHLKYKSPMKVWLNREMEDHRNPKDHEINQMRATFQKSIEMAYSVFGKFAFKRFIAGSNPGMKGYWEDRKLNSALWDTLLYAFSYYEKPQVVPIADKIREEFLNIMTYDDRFIEYVGSTTVTAERIKFRGNEWLRRLDALVQDNAQGARAFTRTLKAKLFEAEPACKLCGQWIQELDDAEVDHIQQYWRVGATIPENARVVHRYCNRARVKNDR